MLAIRRRQCESTGSPAASEYLLKHINTFSHFSLNTFHAVKSTAERVGLMGEIGGLSTTLF